MKLLKFCLYSLHIAVTKSILIKGVTRYKDEVRSYLIDSMYNLVELSSIHITSGMDITEQNCG